MKNYINFRTIFVVFILSILVFTGCAEKKSVITNNETGQKQEIAPAPKTEQDNMTSKETSKLQDVTTEPSVDLEKMAQAKSPVSDINFDFDSSSIRPDAREILKANANYFVNNKVSSIIIEGHCDERGTNEYNMALGEKRAQETKKYLVNLGIKESIMKTVSFGEENPLDPASNEEAWAKNRRSHFVVNK
jgi:peptidoglycan-associated lipoprotein